MSWTGPQIFLVVLVATGFLLLMTNRARPDLVALLLMVSLVLSGLVSPEQAAAGFSQPSMFALAGLFVLTAALERAGAVHWLATRLQGAAGASETRLVTAVMLLGATASLTMNNVAAGALLLPAVVGTGRRAGVPASRLLIPLASGILLGGMATLFTTANIIVNGQLHDLGLASLDMQDYLRVGGPIALAGILYMALLGRHLLPRRAPAGRTALGLHELERTYGLDQGLWELRVQDGSPLAGCTLAESQLGARHGVSLVAVFRGQEARFDPPPDEPMESGDVLLVLGTEERIRALTLLKVSPGRPRTSELPVELTEAVVAPRSTAAGRTLAELRFRERTGLTVVGFWRGRRSYLCDLHRFRLQPGDALLVVGPPSQVAMLARDGQFLVPDRSAGRPMTPSHVFWTLAVAATTMAFAAFGHFPMAQVMLAGATLLILLGCLTLDEAYQAVDWSVLVLVAGMAPLGAALTSTGLGAAVGSWLESLTPWGTTAYLGIVFLMTVLVTQVVGGQVTALLVGPLALPTALGFHPDGDFPRHVAMVMAIGCSTAFLTPMAHPVNALVMTPGGYRARDFAPAGLGLALLVGVLLLLLLGGS